MARVSDVKVTGRSDAEGRSELHVAYVLDKRIEFPKSLVYPIWRLRDVAT